MVIGAALAVVLSLSGAALGGDMADGYEAYDGGDYAGALASWRRAAARGDTEAMTAIASLYMTGAGVRPDAAVAADWYRRAAERGDAVAQLNLGDMLSRGVGTRRDLLAAYVWFGLAAR